MQTATLGQVRKTLEILEGVSRERLQEILESGLLTDLFSAKIAGMDRSHFRKVCGLSPERQVFKVLVDYTKTLQDMVVSGKYGWVNNDITQDHFPVSGQGQKEVEIVLFHFNRAISSDDAIKEIAKAGFRPAHIEELLALGASHQELQKQFPIVALGSVWQYSDGFRRVSCLRWDGDGRGLNLSWFEDDWHGSCRFVAVRNA